VEAIEAVFRALKNTRPAGPKFLGKRLQKDSTRRPQTLKPKGCYPTSKNK